nr:8053_t:CDS:2 [Entrophospora candida]
MSDYSMKVERQRDIKLLDATSGSPWETVTLTTLAVINICLLKETQELALAKLLFLLVGAEWSPFGLSRNEYHIGVGICCMGHQEVAKKILMQLLTQAIADSYNRTAAISWKKPSSTNGNI